MQSEKLAGNDGWELKAGRQALDIEASFGYLSVGGKILVAAHQGRRLPAGRGRVEWPRERHIQDRLSTAPCWAMKGSLPHVTGSHEAVQSRPDLPAPCTPGSLGSHSGTC